MKKLILLLVLSLVVGMLASCGGDAEKKDTSDTVDDTNATASATATVADSASDEFVITKEMVENTLDKVYTDTLSEVKALSGSKELSEEKQIVDGVPAYLSADKVVTLGKSNYTPYYNEFKDYQNRASGAINALVAELPDKCVMSHSPEWIVNAVPHIVRYVVIDSAKIAESDKEDLTLFLERKCYEATHNASLAEYYDFDMAEFEERFAGVGTVLVQYLTGDWIYFNVPEGKFERLEYYPGYLEVKIKYMNISNGHIQDHIDEVLTES